MDRKHHRSRAIGAVVALGLVLGHAGPSGASDLPDPCRFLSPAEASRVTGAPLVTSQRTADSDNAMCLFSQAKGGPPLPLVTINVGRLSATGPASFHGIIGIFENMTHTKARAVDVPGSVAVEHDTTVFVDRGAYFAKFGYLGVGTLAQQRAISEALARAALF